MKRPILWLCIAFILGILSNPVISIASLGCFLCVLILLSVILKITKKTYHKKQILRLVTFVCLSFLIGCFSSCLYYENKKSAYEEVKQSNEIVGRIQSVGEDSLKLDIRTKQGIYHKFKIVVYYESLSFEPEVGEVVKAKGRLALPKAKLNDGEFDYASYCEQVGILYICNADEVTRIKSNNILEHVLFLAKQRIQHTLARLYNPEEAGFLLAMLTGDKAQLSDKMYESFQTYGISHILAVSGLHVGVLGAFLLLIFARFLRKRNARLCALIVLLLFGLMTGYPVSCVRAVGTFSILAFAPHFRRKFDSITSVSLLLMLILLCRPSLISNNGLLLSFGAAGSFAIVIPGFLETKETTTWFTKIRKSLLSCLLLQLCLLPILVRMEYEFSLYAVILNAIVLALVPYLFGLAIISCVMEIVYPTAGLFLAGSVHMLISFYQWLLHVTEELPFATIVTGCPSLLKVTVFYCIMAILLVRNHCSRKLNGRILILAASVVWLFRTPFFGTRITNLSIGQGDCSIVESHGTVVVIDCGSSSKEQCGTEVLLPYLHYHGYSYIDLAMITHLDEDHVNGFEELIMNGLDIIHILIPKWDDHGGQRFLTDAGYFGDVNEVEVDQHFQIQKLSFRIMAPYRDNREVSENETSLVVLMEGESSCLFTGDIGKEVFVEVIRELENLGVDRLAYLKVPHHGSVYSYEEKMFERVKVDHAVVSCGERNLYGHPHKAMLEGYEQEGIHVSRTDLEGQIQINVH